ncbi:MAG: hypothetical protein CL802_13590 [Citromicrobium sp.]|nr:hypothetical protein [Citromicrobium sp.]|tara:strand:- start:1424 stop:1654 length:231 start_codon:yes stop_codon:yes gene_type:complete
MGKQRHLAGQKIRQWRTERKPPLSGEEFADRYGYARAAVYRWEVSGQIPILETVMRLKELGICEPEDWMKPATKVA